ncbi:xanthine dehydrogenase family protein molybdopterin-binding subunit [Sagittula salina]|uniref:Xanthine dehydrogenase family protein molybdopterin-binding subunit n=1 Tax=Sagittula salina TaxID=2820268 RepID=A0A940RZ72_9RHOB|nr:molybdopterin cofactor-binding domain-containing protein [Sagittula salina]MBP0481668.1 xanthine dehydrogenase family protein molybdopterin-binding subunit [Sagittula salina]
MASIGKIARRSFLIGTAAIVGGAAFGAWTVLKDPPNPLKPAEGESVLNPFVLIDGQGITLVSPRAEMGQGTETTWAALIAEELDVTLDQVRIIHGPPAQAYYNHALMGAATEGYDASAFQRSMGELMGHLGKVFSMQVTGGSTAMRDGYDRMRVVGAATREMLVAAAADRLKFDPSEMVTYRGAVIAPDGTKIPYTKLAARAAEMEPPHTELRAREEWKILGTQFRRRDIPPKTTGTATFAIDTRLPGQKFAALRLSPTRAPIREFDAFEVARMPGVEKVVDLGDGLAVIANNTWVAMDAVNRIPVTWHDAAYLADDAAIGQALESGFDLEPDSMLRNDGDVTKLPEGTERVEAEYRVPFLSHATMEPQSANVWFDGGKLKVWTGSQMPTFALRVAAEEAGLDEDEIEFNVTYLGGGFGRRGEVDVVRYATRIAKEMPGSPVLLTYSREEDMTHDFYRPAAVGRFKGAVKAGTAVMLDAKVASAPVVGPALTRAAGFAPGGPDTAITEGTHNQPYAIPAYRARGYAVPDMPPVGFWRSVGNSFNGFFMESFIDELAVKAGADPLQFRMGMTRDEFLPAWEVLNAVKEMSKWTGETPEGVGRGVAMCYSFGTPVAMVLEVRDGRAGGTAAPEGGGPVRITEAWIAADPGVALNPDNIEAQLVGAMVYGLSAAIGEEITFAGGAVQQLNFPDYEPLRMTQMPRVHTRILEIQEHLGGVGEVGTPPAAPALANALFDLRGERYRTLPLRKAVDFAV